METDLNKVIGALDWEITEIATGRTIGEDLTIVRVRDVSFRRTPSGQEIREEVRERLKDYPTRLKLVELMFCALWRRQDPHVSKSVKLMDGFDFALNSSLASDSSQLTGFGLTSPHSDWQLFSFEWFELVGTSHATKLQETGELGVRLEKTGSTWEVIHTVFETDVSLRLIPLFSFPILRPKYRIKIRKGSFVNWPSYKG